MRRRFWLLWALSMCCLGPTAKAEEDRFWVLWERIKYIGQHCPDGASCLVEKSYSSRPLKAGNEDLVYRLFGVADGRSHASAFAREHPDAPDICAPNQAQLALGFAPEAMPRSEKIEVLRGMSALHVDLTGLKSPPGYSDVFGDSIHAQFVRILEGGGIRVVDKDRVSAIPGQPVLNLYFSFTDKNGPCDYVYSVFASLSQDILLARDLRIKVPTGVWSYSTGSTAKDHSGNEEAAILRVAQALLRDHSKVNSR